MGTRYCTNCGTKIDGDSRFCTNCGQSSDDYPTPEINQPSAAPQAPASKKNLLIVVVIIAIVAIAVSAAVVAYFLFSATSENAETAAPESSSQALESSQSADSLSESESPDSSSQASSSSSDSKSVSPKVAESYIGQTPPVFPMVEVSSQLPGDKDTAYYGAWNLTDGDSETAWNEGAAGEGIGETIEFFADVPQHVTSVKIMGGFPKLYKDGSDIYYKNNRPKRITISYDGGSQKFTMKDLRGKFQTFKLKKPVDTTFLTITINSVYKGRKYADCCVAEVEIL